jgi:site-specific DNA recombinase
MDRRGIVTKRRDTQVAKYQGGIPFTYGPLAYFLKNRIYVGDIHYGGKWFKGQHEAIVDRKTFDEVQQLLKNNTVRRRAMFSESGAVLKGKLFDDNGNLMGPSFSSKNGVRYRFYVSTALRGRKHRAGSVTRISALEIEDLIASALRDKLKEDEMTGAGVIDAAERVIVSKTQIQISYRYDQNKQSSVVVPWTPRTVNGVTQALVPQAEAKTDEKLLKAIVRARSWLSYLSSSRHTSIEDLAASAHLHPKVVRQGIRLAFLAPELMAAALAGERPLKLKQIPKVLPLSWREQRQAIG